MSVEALYQEVDSARTSWQDLLSQLANGEADFARSRSVLSDVSLRDFSRQVDLVFELLLSVRPSDGASVSAMVLAAHEANLRPQLQSIASHCTTALNQLRPNWRENTKVADANDAFALQLLADGVAYVAVDLTAYFKHVRAASHALLQTLGAVLPLCKANAITDLSARSESLGDVVRQVDVLRRQAEKSANIAMSFEAKGEKVESGIRELLATTETIVANVRELQLQATTDSSAVSTLVEQIKTIGSVANSLEATVDSYKSKFEAFHAEADGDANDARFVPHLLPVVRSRVSGPRLWLTDRGFADLRRFAEFTAEDDHFLVRYHPKCGFHRDPDRALRHSRDAQGRAILEEWGWLGAATHKLRRYVRRVTLSRPAEEDVILVTDLLSSLKFPATELLELYRERWGIERVFQQVTEIFGLKGLIGGTP